MGMFGWSYPPGCSSVPGDEPCYCEVCGQGEDDCQCPECPVCGDIGNKKCYGDVGEDVTKMLSLCDERNSLNDQWIQLMRDGKEDEARTMLARMEMKEKDIDEFKTYCSGHGLVLNERQIADANKAFQYLEDEIIWQMRAEENYSYLEEELA